MDAQNKLRSIETKVQQIGHLSLASRKKRGAPYRPMWAERGVEVLKIMLQLNDTQRTPLVILLSPTDDSSQLLETVLSV